VLFVSCALLPVSALAALAFREVTSELQAQSERQLQQASKAVAMTLLRRLEGAEAAIASTPEPGDPRRGSGLDNPLTGVLLAGREGPARLLFGEMDTSAFSSRC
jgi:hypothetical protein